MIHFVRSVQVQLGKRLEATAWSKKVIAYVNDNYGANFQLIGNVNGVGHQLHFYATYDSLAGFETVTAGLAEDQGYWAIVAESAGLIGEFEDRFYRSL